MSRKESLGILQMNQEEAIRHIRELAEKAEKYNLLFTPADSTSPSDPIENYKKPNHRRKKKKPGQKKGHAGVSRKKPTQIDKRRDYTLKACPHGRPPVKKNSVRVYTRLIDDIELVKPIITQHTVHGYLYSYCLKVVRPPVQEASPGSMIGLRLMVFTAWLYYAVGGSINKMLKIL